MSENWKLKVDNVNNQSKLIIKRFLDILFSVFGLLLFSWLLLLFWVFAIIDTRTNGIFIQERIGQFGQPFKIFKFRTIQMLPNSEVLQVSKIGEFLRKYKLDELPQLINILKGEMSVVGPRPDIAGYYDLLQGENRKILKLKPGLTGLASLKYFNEEAILKLQEDSLSYNDNVLFPDKVRLNLEYYYSQSLFGDLKIIVYTFMFLFRKKVTSTF